MSSGITFSGLGSGVDTNAIVSQLMTLERLPIRNVERDKTQVQTRQGVVQEINTLLTTLRDKARTLMDSSNFGLKTASTTDATILNVLADSTAASGAYNVTVTALSKAHTLASTAAPVLNDDTLHITVGTDTIDVAANATDTLQDLADRINGTDGTPVSASVINDKLVLISRTTGSAGNISVTADAGLDTALGLGTTQPGQDAAATVNGLAVTSSGNSITGAIAGVTLNLTKEGSAVVNVGLDSAGIEEKVKEFVNAYNAVIDNISRTTKYDAATKTRGTLQGDQSLTGFLSQLRGVAGSAVGALAGGEYDSLAQIGITTSTDRSGKLEIDSTKLKNALLADSNAVSKVFGADDENGQADSADGIAFQLEALAENFTSEVLKARLQGFTDQLGRMDKKISDLEVVMELKEKRLRAQFVAMEQAVSSFRAQGTELLARLGLG